MLIHDFAGDVVDTREEAARPGPFCDELAVVLHFSEGEDEARGDFTVFGTGRRFGRRILWCDTQGFMCVERYPSAGEAQVALNGWADDYEQDEDDGERWCESCGESYNVEEIGENGGLCVHCKP